jgi:hypothetical protein
MITGGDAPRDLSRLVVPLRGSLKATGDLFEPYWLADPAGRAVGPAAAYLREVAASGRAVATQRSYGMDLLRWFRFLWAVEINAGSGDPGGGPGLSVLDSAGREAVSPAFGGIRAAARPAAAGSLGGRRGRRTR